MLGSPQTGRFSPHLLISNPTALQRALGYLGTWPSPFPVQSREVRKAQGCCLPSWLHQASAWDCRSRLSSASHKEKYSFCKSALPCSPAAGAPGQCELSGTSPVCAYARACEAGVADPAGVTCRCAWLPPAQPVSHALGGAERGSAGNRCRNETDRHKAAGRRAPEPGGCALARSLWP